jgi:ribosomal subunit interface protein
MQIKIVAQNIKLNEAQEKMVRSKIEKLATYAARVSDESSEIKIDISHEKSKKPEHAFRCVLTLFVPRDTLRAKARHESLRSVIDEVVEKVKGQIERYKVKVQHVN